MSELKFILNQFVPIEESRHYEFKEVKGAKPVNTIKNTADEYVVAFLNSGGGRIYWGIRDSDRAIVGVRLCYSDRDKLRRIVTEKLMNIQPAIAPSAYRIILHGSVEKELVTIAKGVFTRRIFLNTLDNSKSHLSIAMVSNLTSYF